jgi:hypothetical protein
LLRLFKLRANKPKQVNPGDGVSMGGARVKILVAVQFGPALVPVLGQDSRQGNERGLTTPAIERDFPGG